jgi:6-phosphogluconolactonase
VAKPQLDVSPDLESLAMRLADWLVARLAETTGPFAFNLSGGSTPKTLYQLLATEAYRRKIDWERMHIFFGDERFVPWDHADSNYRMAREAMLSKVPIPAENVHPVRTDEATPEAAAADYEAALKRFYGKATLDIPRPLFAVTLLGLGDDGHTASLFPGTVALNERQKWVTAVVGAKPEPRITMTYPTLESSAATIFLIAGAAKREMLDRMLAGDMTLPASRVRPQGEVYVFCDEAANGDV